MTKVKSIETAKFSLALNEVDGIGYAVTIVNQAHPDGQHTMLSDLNAALMVFDMKLQQAEMAGN